MSSPILQKALINGRWVSASRGQTFAVTNPATGEVIGHVPEMGADETERAIAAAREAATGWATLPARDRGMVLRRWNDLILENREMLANVITREQGKPLAEAAAEVDYAARFIEWFAEEGRRCYGKTVPAPHSGQETLTLKEPVGVVAVITPWNFPAAMLARKWGPALAAGCTVVTKPSELTPFTAFALGFLAQEAGIPAGVLNIISGTHARMIGETLCHSPHVRKLSFTGSVPVGKHLYAQCAGTMKRLSLELGGNAPFIVFEDADLDLAVAGIMQAKFRNAGQTCVSANRILVQQSVYHDVLRLMTEAVKNIRLGPGDQRGVTMGPLITPEAVQKVQAMVDDALSLGATIVQRGLKDAVGPNFMPPIVMGNVTPGMQVFDTEIFGPVAAVTPFQDEEEAMVLANGTPYGLAAYLYSRDVNRCWRVARGLDVGMVGVNESLLSAETTSFGGVKDSGLGREGGPYGIDDYLNVKHVAFNVAH